MPVLYALGLMFVLGAIGGLVNALIAHGGFIRWQSLMLPDGRRIWQPGFLGNMIVGGFAAVVTAAFYTPFGSLPIDTVLHEQITVLMIIGPVFSGISGARLLQREVDMRNAGQTQRDLANALRQAGEE
jgi:hypothetical protein